MVEETLKGRRKLNPTQLENRVIWVEALLSDEYRQGRTRLRYSIWDEESRGTVDTWCCLGVAGNCIAPGADFVAEGSQSVALPIKWAREHFGLARGYEGEEQDTLAGWNDVRGLTFKQIADRIALATDKTQYIFNVPRVPSELDGLEPGEYARNWLERMSN